jgi:hypothetical protein
MKACMSISNAIRQQLDMTCHADLPREDAHPLG